MNSFKTLTNSDETFCYVGAEPVGTELPDAEPGIWVLVDMTEVLGWVQEEFSDHAKLMKLVCSLMPPTNFLETFMYCCPANNTDQSYIWDVLADSLNEETMDAADWNFLSQFLETCTQRVDEQILRACEAARLEEALVFNLRFVKWKGNTAVLTDKAENVGVYVQNAPRRAPAAAAPNSTQSGLWPYPTGKALLMLV